MHPVVFNYTPADDSLNGFANDITGAGPFVPTTLTPGDGLAHKVSINSAANLSGITFTLTGKDAEGRTQVKTLVGPTAGNTVYSTDFFSRLTLVSASSTLGGNTADIGWKDECISPAHVLNWRQDSFQVSIAVNISGTIDYTVEHCFQRMSDGLPSTLTWWPHAALVGDTTDGDGNYAFPVTATRLHINSLTAGATVAFHVVQAN